MTRFSVSIALVIAAVGLASGQQGQLCIHTKLVTPCHFFETDKILGTWYGIEIYSGIKADAKPLSLKCLEVNFTRTSDPLELLATENFVNLDSGLPQVDTDKIVIDTSIPIQAIWKVYSNEGLMTSDAVWIHTDYDNWAIQYGCAIVDKYRLEKFTFWSRERTIDAKTLDILRILAKGYGFPLENVSPIDQAGC